MNNKEKGQSLVELALMAPVLIILFIGVLEVGWILRAHLVLANASREAARFSVRSGYITFEAQGYRNIVAHTYDAIAGQLEFRKYGTEIISVVQIDTQQVCDPSNVDAKGRLVCDCHSVSTNPYSQTLVITPLTAPTFTYKYPSTSLKESRVDFIKLIDSVVVTERFINCQLQMRASYHRINQIVIVELFYDQPQLLGFPLLSNPYTDPVPHYIPTTMRMLYTRK